MLTRQHQLELTTVVCVDEDELVGFARRPTGYSFTEPTTVARFATFRTDSL
tara:strand:- start:210 stop:362 length:153 start_codon:yes stop_codon:yes gene_type:complete